MTEEVDLCTIGKLAECAGVPRSTVNYYCRMGLIEHSDRTPGGFRLFERKYTAGKIKHVQDLLNVRPRKVLDFETPYEAFEKLAGVALEP